MSEECDFYKQEGKDKEARHCYTANYHIDDVKRRGLDLWRSNRGGFKEIIPESPTKVSEIRLIKIYGDGDGTVSVSSGRSLIGKGGNPVINNNGICNLKHDAAMSGSGDDGPSRECIKMIINDIKSILQQQIDKFKAEHPNCKILEDEPKAMCVDEK